MPRWRLPLRHESKRLSLCTRIASPNLENQIMLLTDQLKKLSPRGTLRSRPALNTPRRTETQAAAQENANGAAKTGTNAISVHCLQRSMCLRYAVSAGCLPAMQPLIAVRSRGTDAALSLRIAADRKRMPTVSRFSAPAPVSLDPRRFARRRVDGSVWPSARRMHRSADGDFR